MSGNNTVVAVDDDRIDEAELTERGAKLIDLLRGMGTGIVLIGDQFVQRDELKLGGGSHRTSPHSANFSKPPISLMYARAISTISEYGLPSTVSSPMPQHSSTGLPVSCAFRKA